jgi:hypothetical protein
MSFMPCYRCQYSERHPPAVEIAVVEYIPCRDVFRIICPRSSHEPLLAFKSSWSPIFPFFSYFLVQLRFRRFYTRVRSVYQLLFSPFSIHPDKPRLFTASLSPIYLSNPVNSLSSSHSPAMNSAEKGHCHMSFLSLDDEILVEFVRQPKLSLYPRLKCLPRTYQDTPECLCPRHSPISCTRLKCLPRTYQDTPERLCPRHSPVHPIPLYPWPR